LIITLSSSLSNNFFVDFTFGSFENPDHAKTWGLLKITKTLGFSGVGELSCNAKLSKSRVLTIPWTNTLDPNLLLL
jgi:hypothetical protein